MFRKVVHMIYRQVVRHERLIWILTILMVVLLAVHFLLIQPTGAQEAPDYPLVHLRLGEEIVLAPGQQVTLEAGVTCRVDFRFTRMTALIDEPAIPYAAPHVGTTCKGGDWRYSWFLERPLQYIEVDTIDLFNLVRHYGEPNAYFDLVPGPIYDIPAGYTCLGALDIRSAFWAKDRLAYLSEPGIGRNQVMMYMYQPGYVRVVDRGGSCWVSDRRQEFIDNGASLNDYTHMGVIPELSS